MKDEVKPKTVVTGRGYIEDELIENIKNTDGFQRAVDYHKNNMIDDVKVTYNLKADEKKNHIIINSEGITREITSEFTSPEVKEKVANDLKKKDKVNDVFPVSSYSWE
jgi:hypothetical protein